MDFDSKKPSESTCKSIKVDEFDFPVNTAVVKSSITIQQLLGEATKYEQIASAYRGIAESLKGINPNIELVIPQIAEIDKPNVPPESQAPRIGSGLSSATKLDAVKWVLKNAHPRALDKSEIATIMQTLGHKITPETLSSYLSRNKEIFTTQGRGLWKLIDPHGALERDDET